MFAIVSCLIALQTAFIEIEGKQIRVELAAASADKERGLMGRSSLPPGEGMLFIYDKAEMLCFWMKDTLIPLTVAFFDEKKKLTQLCDMPVAKNQRDPLPLFKSKQPALYALEAPFRWFQENGIGPGAEFSFLDQQIRVE